MSSSISLPAVAAVLLGGWILKRCLFSKGLPLQSPPSPSWIWGHERRAFEEDCGEYYGRWLKAFGPAFKIRGALGFGEILVLADPEAIAHIYVKKTFDYRHSDVILPIIDRILGRSLVYVQDKDDHRRLRTQLNPLFTTEKIKDMEPDVIESTTRFHHKLTDYVLSHGRSTVINLLNWSWVPMLDVIGRVGFNHDFECGESAEAKAIDKAWKDQVNLGMDLPGFIALVVLRAMPWITSLPFESIQKQGDIKVMVKKLGQKLLERGEQSTGKDLLSTLIRMNAAQGYSESSDQLLDHICTFVLVGYETTAGAMNYILWQLARHPDVQARLREELSAFPGQPTYDEITNKFPYLDAVCKEGLRLHPPSSHTEKIAVRDDILPLRFPVKGSDGKLIHAIPIKAGQTIFIPSINVNKLDCVWGDGDTFRPERWLPPNELPPVSSLNQGWANLFSFSEGPRSCIGYRLALFELKMNLFMLVRNFVFHDTGAVIKSKFSATLQPRVVGKEADGPNLPVRVTLVEDL